MMFSREFAVQGGLTPLWRVHAWALERAGAVPFHSGDVRWALVALALRALAAVEAVLQEKLTAWARNVIGRALRGARFAATADTTVATGGVQVQALFRAIGSLA